MAELSAMARPGDAPDEDTRRELKGKDEDEEAHTRLEEMKKQIEAKRALRRANFSPDRPDASFLRTLDSSIKRNTAVIKKLKQINEEQRDGLLEELKSVNLSKFVTEAVTSICDAKLKSSDINAAVQVCSLLHQRYKDFAPNLVQGLLKVFLPGKAGEELDSDRSSRAMRKRSTLKLLMELYVCGVTEDAGIFVSIVKDLTSSDHLRDREATQTNLSLLVAFTRQGRFLLGLPLGGPDGQEEFYKEINASQDHKKQLKKMIQSFYDSAVFLLQSEHAALRQIEHENARMLNAKGELSEENAASYEKMRKSYDHLFRSISSLAEAMDIQPPVMPEDAHTTRLSAGEEGASSPAGKEPASVEPIWDDEDTRLFYEGLPDLRAFVPAVLLGESESKAGESKTPEQEVRADSELGTPEVHVPSNEAENASGEVVPEEKNPNSEKAREKEKDKDEPESSRKEKEHEKEKWKTFGDGGNLDSLLQRLPGAVSRDLIDQLTVDFCYVNSKSNRKKLVRTLFNVPRTSLELLPHYSRMVATLSTCMKDITPMLLQLLEDEFNFLINKKDQMNIETKIKNIRFLGELAKFRVAPSTLIFTCLKSCLDDFSHHNIDVACNLLETCGRFLYRSPETSVRMGNMLDIIMRLKNVKNLDARHSTLVENAYYQCRPPERSARVSKVRPLLHQYIRKLLFLDLDKSSIERILRQLRKMPWDECEDYVLKCFMKVHKIKYNQVHLVASLTAGLNRYHDSFAVAVVDEVLEEIRVGLEQNEYGMQQRRIVFMRFLGELYNYRLIDSCVIFETLYLIIFYGHGTPEQELLDPTEDYFRIRLVIMLLQTCGQFFDRGSSKRKLDRFLLFFQRYVLAKGSIPLDVEFDLQDLFADLRPKMTRYATFEEANQALLEMEERENMMMEKAANGKYLEMEVPFSAEPSQVVGNGGNGLRRENGVDEGESLSETESGSMDGHEEEEDDVERDEEGEEEEEEAELEHAAVSEEDDHVKLRCKSKEVDPLEDADFEKELRALMQESVDSRKSELRARPTLNMMMPMNLLEGTKDHGRAQDPESGDEGIDEHGSGHNVAFRVLVKKGNKHQLKQLKIPRDSSLVQSTRQKEAAELEEKQDIKRLVLEYNEREEDERSGGTTQPLNWSSSSPSRSPGGGRGGAYDAGSAARSSVSRQRRPLAAGYGRRR
ncbi:regulator of nonsense transcripts UPF2 [Selaginella moellendorffii]|uniref:regulator of nonsense transcripts UPF2 n=1 Tax=Selaginella moellendorffii TaxID=88036 RepID=UPI000D1CAF7B|nr:regulator of nonsense transcripts UPF2 [Selaginella moellendorffii]|eukprot:XP_024530355.1 regulator of nonsense transcripts UPF2 [Selaginella moellendorffii]